jgi:hypothetical protein
MEVKEMENYQETVKRPGKFEGEQAYVPYYWDIFLNSGADKDNGKVLTFNVSKEDKAIFPELKQRKTVKLLERDDGFVVEV